MKKIATTVLAMTLGFASTTLMAEGKSILDMLEKSGLKVSKTVPVNEHINSHLMIDQSGAKQVLFTDASNKMAIDGRLINFNGQVLNGEYVDLLNPPKPFSEVKALIDEIETIDIVYKKDAPTLYMLSESLCPACAAAHDDMKSILSSGEVNLKIIPVSFHDGAKEVWAKIYEAEDKLKALDEAFMALKLRKRPEMAKSIPSDVIKTLGGANQVMSDLRASSTPTFFYEIDGRVNKFSGADPSKMAQAVIELNTSKVFGNGKEIAKK